MRYLILLFVYYYIRQILGMVMSKVVHFSESLTLTFLMFFGEFFGGLAIILYHKLTFYKKRQTNHFSKANTLGSIELIQGQAQMNNIDGTFKIHLLIFFISFFDFNEFLISLLIPEIAIISPTSDQRLRIIITIISSLLCTYTLRLKTGKHHTFSLIGMGSCSLIIFIIELIYKIKGTDFGNFILAHILVLCRLAFVSLIDVSEKYLVEYNFIDKFRVLSTEGFFGIIFCLIYSFIISKNPIVEIDKVYQVLDLGKKILLIIFLILYFVLSAACNIYKITCNIVYNPMAKSLPAYFFNPFFMIYYFIFENDFTIEGKRNYFYFVINFILSIIIDIFAAIYNEFFILNCLGLQKDTHYGISERALDNSLVELDDVERQNSIEKD